MGKELASFDVKGKENAAQRWASHVSTKTETTWRYLLVGETQIETARFVAGSPRTLIARNVQNGGLPFADCADSLPTCELSWIIEAGESCSVVPRSSTRSHPEMQEHLDLIAIALERPTRHCSGRAANEEWYFLASAGPSRWLHVVVHFVGAEGTVTTAFGRRRLP